MVDSGDSRPIIFCDYRERITNETFADHQRFEVATCVAVLMFTLDLPSKPWVAVSQRAAVMVQRVRMLTRTLSQSFDRAPPRVAGAARASVESGPPSMPRPGRCRGPAAHDRAGACRASAPARRPRHQSHAAVAAPPPDRPCRGLISSSSGVCSTNKGDDHRRLRSFAPGGKLTSIKRQRRQAGQHTQTADHLRVFHLRPSRQRCSRFQ